MGAAPEKKKCERDQQKRWKEYEAKRSGVFCDSRQKG